MPASKQPGAPGRPSGRACARIHRQLLSAGLAAACVLALTTTAAAQGTPAPSPAPVAITEQVEVVATRVPEPTHDVPASVEVIDGETLRAMGATSLRDALSLAAGVDVGPGGDGGPAAAVPEFWGLREFDAFLLVVDDIPRGGAFNPDLATLNLRDVERIEILRGSAPVTYGATSFVGVIHVVHQPAAARRSYASARGGTFASGGAAIDLALSGTDAWTSRLSANVDRQGYSDARTSFRRGHVSYRGSTHDQDRKTWVSSDFSWLDQQPSSPHARAGAVLSAATPLDANYNPAGAFLQGTRISVAAGTERALKTNARWTATASYARSAQGIFRGFLSDLASTPQNATGFRQDIGIQDIYADTHVVWARRSRVQIVTGGDLLFGNGEGSGATFRYTVPLTGATATRVDQPTELTLDSESRRAFSGAYAQVEWTPAARLQLSSGVRLNGTWERRGEGAGATHVKPSGTLGAMFGVWTHGADHVRLFASYRDTFKPAAFDFSLAENEGLLQPESARSYEGGMKLRAAGGRFDLEASGFRMDFKNLVTATIAGGLPSLENAGSTRFQGFEIAAEARAPRRLVGRATYSLHDGRFVDFVQDFDGANTQLGGNRFEMSARHLFSAGLILVPDTGVTGSIVVKYTGERFLNKRNTALAAPFTTMDGGIGYRRGRYEARIDGRNLTDRRDPVSESELGEAQYYRLPSRQVDLSVNVTF